MHASPVPLALGSPGEAPAARDRLGVLGDDVVVRALGAVLCLEEEPLGLPALGASADQVPASLQLLSVEDDVEVAFAALLVELAWRHGVVRAAVPDDAVAGAVLAVGDAALEVAVGERVVLGLDGEPLLRRIVTRSLGAGPAGEHPVDLEPQVVVKTGRIVLVHHEAQRAGRGGGCALGRGLGCDREVALLPVGFERIVAAGHGVLCLPGTSARHPRSRKGPRLPEDAHWTSGCAARRATRCQTPRYGTPRYGLPWAGGGGL